MKGTIQEYRKTCKRPFLLITLAKDLGLAKKAKSYGNIRQLRWPSGIERERERGFIFLLVHVSQKKKQ